MKQAMVLLVLSTFGLSAASAFAADMTNEERTALRERAAALQAERAQRGDQVRSDVDFKQKRGEVQLPDKRADVNKAQKTRKTGKKTKRTPQSSVHKAKVDANKSHATR
ncbi:MAG: hypothetical protein ACXWUH_09635 [Burkholderiales bacterium]